MTHAARWLRCARSGAGLTQRGLARRVGRPQARIDEIESSRNDTTVETLCTLLAATGIRLIPIPTTSHSAAEAAYQVACHLTEHDEGRALRVVFQLNDDLVRERPEVAAALVAQPPATVGDPRWDALIAALVEHRSPICPAWASERLVTEPWQPGPWHGPIDDVPPVFRRHGVLISAGDLESV